ncbi:MAG TPA: hypothetical protein PK843_16510 [bacterium]|nr:hypothetical protein [bacterium]HPN36115.1 hypothetical protein [bacterium]
MNRLKKSLFLLAALCWGWTNAAGALDLQAKLQQDIEDERLDRFSLIEAAFILSGADTEDSLAVAMNWYRTLLGRIKEYHFDPFDREGSAAKVFGFLHSSWLITYREQATTLLDVIRHKQFNCVAGTILYNLVCADLGWPTEAFETPTHTYTLFSHFARRLMVENTTPMGFNITQNLAEYSRYLLQFYPDHRAAQIGLDRIYAHENSNGRVISNTELLGLLAYNRAYLAAKEEAFDRAYQFVLLAQKFNRDSRSNVDFEINLYHRWGRALFDKGLFYEAFTVLADGFYRYRRESSLAQNCRVALFGALNQYGRHGRWAESQGLLQELRVLNLPMSEEDRQTLRDYMRHWITHFIRTGEREALLSALELLQHLGLDDGSFEPEYDQAGVLSRGRD